MLKHFSQKDPRWADVTIGTSNLTIKEGGCVVCSIASLLAYYGIETTHAELAKKLQFTKDGLIYWRSVTNLYPDVQFHYRLRQEFVIYKPLIEILLEIKNPVLIEIQPGNYKHWLCILEKKDNKFLIADPLKDDLYVGDLPYPMTGLTIYRYDWPQIEFDQLKQKIQNIKVALNNILNFL